VSVATAWGVDAAEMAARYACDEVAPETDPDLLRTLDLTQPVGLMLVAILHFVKDADDPYAHVRRLVAAMPSGQLPDHHPRHQRLHAAGDLDRVNAADTRTQVPFQFRSRDEFARFLTGLELVPPGSTAPSPGSRSSPARPAKPAAAW
jgi:S-adenosyl methyltransferase